MAAMFTSRSVGKYKQFNISKSTILKILENAEVETDSWFKPNDNNLNAGQQEEIMQLHFWYACVDFRNS